MLKEVRPEDLLKYGLIPEFIGRLPVIASLNELSQEELIRILVEPKDAIVRQYQKLFELEGVKLKFTDGALRAIATLSVERKSGATRSARDSGKYDARYHVRTAVHA